MTNFKYYKISKTKKIRYLCNYYKKNLYIVFLHGFMSDLEGEKPKVFLKYAKKNKLGFLAIEYSGHGKSSGEFTKGNISKWTSDTKVLIKNIIKKNDFVLIGSSMGSWISLNQFKYFKKQIKGFLGIGSAPEFLEKIMWKKFTKKMKAETKKNGVYNLKHGGYEYPITYQLIKDGKKNKLGFLAIEYSGHGKSSGEFTKGNISKWTSDTKVIIKNIIKKNNFVLIGSSMGSWISLNQFKYFQKQIKGFLGIGSAPEFLDRIMWKKFTKKMKIETKNKGVYNLKHGGYEYPITYQLIKDGRKNKILNKKIKLEIPVTMIHGSNDTTVPISLSRKVLKLFNNAKKKLLIIKNGDHSLFSKKLQKKIVRELDFFF